MSVINNAATAIVGEANEDMLLTRTGYKGPGTLLLVIQVIIELVKIARECNKTPQEAKALLGTVAGRRAVQREVAKHVRGPVVARVTAMAVARVLRRMPDEDFVAGFAEQAAQGN